MEQYTTIIGWLIMGLIVFAIGMFLAERERNKR